MKTMKLILVLAIVCMVSSASAGTPIFFENWENGINNPPWAQTGTQLMALSTAHNHTPGGTKSVEQPANGGTGCGLSRILTEEHLCWYLDYWLYDPLGAVTNTINSYAQTRTYSGGGITGTAMQCMTAGMYSTATGVNSTKYQYRYGTAQQPGGWLVLDFPVTRSIGWHNFRIEGCRTGTYTDPTYGDITYYIDGVVRATVTNKQILSVTNVRVGSNLTSTGPAVYFDDVEFGSFTCVPEPSSLIAIACGMVSLIGLRRRRA